MPYFSVLLPASNAESTIFKCLRSIESQSFSDFNVLILVNNSVDNTFTICSGFCETKSKFSCLNLGHRYSNLSQILNFGFASLRSNCTYIVRHDSDDYMLDHRLQHTYTSINARCDLPLIHAGNAYIDNTKTLMLPSESLSDIYLKAQLLLYSPFVHPSIALHSSLPVLYDERFQYAQDLKLFVDNIFHGHYSYTPIPYISYTSATSGLRKRSMQLACHDIAIHSLHARIFSSLTLRNSHELRCQFVSNEYQIYPIVRPESVSQNLQELKTRFVDAYRSLFLKSFS